MPVFSAEEAKAKLRALPKWKLEHGEIVRNFEFPDFAAAMDFVNAVAEQAEQAGHHPDIDIRYSRVRLALSSHDAGGLTLRDFDLAGAIDSIER